MTALNRQDWLALRRTGIGGSDIAAILGLSKFKTGYQLWLEKTGRSNDEPSPESVERMHWGNILEDVVARHYSEKTGNKIQRINTTLRSHECQIALANIDRSVIEEGKRARWDATKGRVMGAKKVLEVKTAHAFAEKSSEWGASGTDEVPQQYWLQCQWYMGITGLPVSDLAVLFGGQKFTTYTIEADQSLFSDMLEEAEGWWNKYVAADTPPPASCEEDARRIWSSHASGKAKIVGLDVADAVKALQELKQEIKELEQTEKELKDMICISFEDAESITHMGQKLATWKASAPKSKTDWAAVADALKGHVSPEQFEQILTQNTTTTSGARTLRLAA